MLTLLGATEAAIQVFNDTEGTTLDKLHAALAEYTARLLDDGVVILAERAMPLTPVAPAEAAEWLGRSSGHPRFSREHWRDLLAQPGLLPLAEVGATARMPDQQPAVRSAVMVLRAHYDATGVPWRDL